MRKLNSLGSLVETIQSHEKEKLLIYSAKHMDELHSGSDILRGHIEIIPQTDYNNSALERLEMLISEAVEGIQCEKIDLIESTEEKATPESNVL